MRYVCLTRWILIRGSSGANTYSKSHFNSDVTLARSRNIFLFCIIQSYFASSLFSLSLFLFFSSSLHRTCTQCVLDRTSLLPLSWQDEHSAEFRGAKRKQREKICLIWMRSILTTKKKSNVFGNASRRFAIAAKSPREREREISRLSYRNITAH